MKIDKLKLREEIQDCFNNESVKNIKSAIKILKIMRFTCAEPTVFVFLMLPMLAMTIYSFISESIDVAISTGVILMLTHFILYKTLYKKFLLKKSKPLYDELDYTIEVLNEIKSEKEQKNLK